MTKLITVLALLLATSSVNAQILECIAIKDTNWSVQFAKYKSEKLRSANGTIYERGGYNHKKDITFYSAITKIGIENIWLANKPIFIEGLETYPSSIEVVFTNKMVSNAELVCYDLLLVNKKRVSNGVEPSPVTVSDFNQ